MDVICIAGATPWSHDWVWINSYLPVKRTFLETLISNLTVIVSHLPNHNFDVEDRSI